MAQTTFVFPQACDCPAPGNDPSTNGTAIVDMYGGPGCTGPATINGTMTEGVAVSGVTMTIYANVTTLGTYDLIATENGVTFTGSGTFTTVGCQPITLTASGTPTSAGSFTWCTNTTPQGCGTITVAPGAGTITSLNCGSATNAGTLTDGVTASGVSSTIPNDDGYGSVLSGMKLANTCEAPPAPISGGDQSYCDGATVPSLSVSSSATTVNWYDSSTKDNLLHTGLTFTPSGAQLPAVGATRTYYVEAVKNCTANLTQIL